MHDQIALYSVLLQQCARGCHHRLGSRAAQAPAPTTRPATGPVSRYVAAALAVAVPAGETTYLAAFVLL